MSDERLPPPVDPQRLLEGWLPLAQEANTHYGWGLAAADLEGLILAAAARLQQTRSALEARAILWFAHARQQTREDHD